MRLIDGELKEEELGELTVPLKSRPTRYALAKFLASVELPSFVSVSRLVEVSDDSSSSASSSSSSDEIHTLAAGPLPRVVESASQDNGARGQLFSLRESLQQHLELLLPPADDDEQHSAHAHFNKYWRWSCGDAKAAEARRGEELDLYDDPGMGDAQQEADEAEEIVVLMAGDGFPITESPKQSLTVLRFGLGNLKVLQQSCDAWPLLGIIDADESDPVVRSFHHRASHCLYWCAVKLIALESCHA
jgi:hypothetical protein